MPVLFRELEKRRATISQGLEDAREAAEARANADRTRKPWRDYHGDWLFSEATGKLTAAALRRFALQALQRPAGTSAADAAPADPGAEVVFDIAADHPAFAGHFPGHPVLPGVVLLTLVLQAVERQPVLRARLGPQPRIDSAKFLAPVGPGARLHLTLLERGAGLAFEVRQGAQAVARGQLSAGATA